MIFLSTLSLRRATAPPYNLMIHHENFYPRSPCGERPEKNQGKRGQIQISIHALLAESDQTKALKVAALRISIHALLAESDMIHPRLCNAKPNFYPRSPCGERRAFFMFLILSYEISIHALLAESDHPQTSNHPHNTNFYPRSPCGERR